MMRTLKHVTALSVSVAVLALPARTLACTSDTVTTGLDPTQLQTSAAIAFERMTLTPNATKTVQTLHLTDAYGTDTEVTITLPYRESLRIQGIGSATGTGDASLGYTRLLSCGVRWRAAAGLATSFDTGNANFTSGGLRVAPAAAISYRVARWIRLVLAPSYALPFTQRRDFPTVRTAELAARSIFYLPHGAYAAIGSDAQAVSGDYRYDAATASFTLGDVVSGHYNISGFYALPITKFTYDHVERSAIGLQFSFQR